MYSLLLVLVFLMTGAGGGGKRRQSSAQQPKIGIEDVSSEYVPADESETESTDLEALAPEVLSKKKGKEPAGQGKGKGKLPSTRGRKKTGGVEIREPTSDHPRRSVQQEDPIDPKRRAMHSEKLCIGERAVGV